MGFSPILERDGQRERYRAESIGVCILGSSENARNLKHSQLLCNGLATSIMRPTVRIDLFHVCFVIPSIPSRGSKTYLALESEAIMVRFHVVHDRLGQALEGLPDELCLSDEVKEQVYTYMSLLSIFKLMLPMCYFIFFTRTDLLSIQTILTLLHTIDISPSRFDEIQSTSYEIGHTDHYGEDILQTLYITLRI
ncbi:uncharacterized protein LOC108867577 [Pyrus x bretschneideri]|uniref:uncharacterized protein LOC108867577 n=1 Tax=Pyrus x bretschneideri TaxID=225117 RepID=UPI00202F44D0|nr:uncharacterized protein LOC108867577 [Pyrus x bretschneideri]